MNKKIGITGIWILFLVFISYFMLQNRYTCVLEIELLYWWELLITLIIGATGAYIYKLWFSHKKLVVTAFYLLMITQTAYFVKQYFWIYDLENIFLESPIIQIIKYTVTGIVFGVYLYYVYKVIIGIHKYLYKFFLSKLRKREEGLQASHKSRQKTKKQQSLEYYMSILLFLTKPTLIVLWIIYVFGPTATVLGYGAAISGILVASFAFAVKNIFNDYIAGLWIQFEDLIHVGDWVTIKDHKGKIVKIGLRTTELITLNRDSVRIPNGIIIENNFTNHIKDKYHGIKGLFSFNGLLPDEISSLIDSLRVYIKKELHAAGDTEFDQEEPRINLTIEEIVGENVQFSFSFILKVDPYNPIKETKSQKFWRDQKLEQDTKKKIYLEILRIKNNIKKKIIT